MSKSQVEVQREYRERKAREHEKLKARVEELESVIAGISCLLANRKEKPCLVDEAFKMSNDAMNGLDWTPREDIFNG